jgi:hypothetical protein
VDEFLGVDEFWEWVNFLEVDEILGVDEFLGMDEFLGVDAFWGVDEFFANFRLSYYEDISERMLLFLYSFLSAPVLRLLCFIFLHII